MTHFFPDEIETSITIARVNATIRREAGHRLEAAAYEVYADKLQALRTRILSRDSTASVEEIDDILSNIPPGVNNAVDLALGRRCATLPVRADYGLNDALQLLQLQAEIELTRQVWRET